MSKDRKDGIYIKPDNPINAIMPYLMEKRCEAEVSKKDILDITNLVEWVDDKNKKLDFKMTYFQAIAGVLSKVIYNRPLLNRFVQGHRTYQRKYVSISFVAKNKLKDNAEERLIVLEVPEDINAIELAHKMAIDVFNTRKDGTNEFNNTLNILTKIPRFLMRIVTKVVKWLDYHGWTPELLKSGDSNYSTILLSNLGSIKCDSCYHHLNNYGTNSIVITIGTIRKEKGKSYVDITSTIDERIADGFYFAKSMKLAQEIISNPNVLEEKLSSNVDFDI